MIREATEDISEHLREIDEKLASFAEQPREDPAFHEEKKRIENERQSAEQCLQICENVRSYIQGIQDSLPPADTQPSEPRTMTDTAFNEVREKMVLTISGLQSRLSGLSVISQQSMAGTGTTVEKSQLEQDRARLMEEIDSARKCLEVCNLASEQASHQRVHVFEDISVDENSQQYIVSTVGDLLNARNVRAGNGSSQLLGSLTDDTLQRLSHDRVTILTSSANGSGPPFTGKKGSRPNLDDKTRQVSVGNTIVSTGS